jgi:hypothetical protein
MLKRRRIVGSWDTSSAKYIARLVRQSESMSRGAALTVHPHMHTHVNSPALEKKDCGGDEQSKLSFVSCRWPARRCELVQLIAGKFNSLDWKATKDWGDRQHIP